MKKSLMNMKLSLKALMQDRLSLEEINIRFIFIVTILIHLISMVLLLQKKRVIFILQVVQIHLDIKKLIALL